MNLGGNNIESGNIQLEGQVGIGVEQIWPTLPSELTLTGNVTSAKPNLSFSFTSNGGQAEEDFPIDTGATSGEIIVDYDMLAIPDELQIVYDGNVIYDTGEVSNTGHVDITYGPGTGTIVTLIMNPGGNPDPGTWWYLNNVQIIPKSLSLSGLIKYGSQRLNIQGEGTYTGTVDIAEGVLRAQNNTALGAPGGGAVTVESGAALELMDSIPANNGGIDAGIEVWGKQLILNGDGDQSNGMDDDAPLVNIASNPSVGVDNMWRGGVTLNASVPIDVEPGTRLTLYGTIDDATNTNSTGSQLIKIGTGELVLAGANTYRGGTDIQDGILTVDNSQALGTSTTYGTLVEDGAQLQMEGGITIAGQPLTIQGSGMGSIPSSVPVTWFEEGPAPVDNGETPGTNETTSGRVTGVATDPSDPNVIYLATAGGGAWKTEDDGLTWTQMFDLYVPGSSSNIVCGAIAVAPSDPRVIYLGTGEADNSNDSYYGTGVYKSTDSGHTWTLLTDQINLSNPNPLYGRAVSSIAVDWSNNDLIYVGVSDLAVNGLGGNPGVWRYNGTSWFNLTAYASDNRNLLTGVPGQAPYTKTPPGTPGPDDDYRISWPQTGAAWYSVTLTEGGMLYAALGIPGGYYGNAVYRCINASSATAETGSYPVWYIGDPTKVDARSANEFPCGPFTGGGATNGRISLTATPYGDYIYAMITSPSGGLLSIQLSTDGGNTWKAITAPPNCLGSQGAYATAMVVTSNNVLFVGGQQIYMTVNGGTAWTNISTDSTRNGPHVSDHTMTIDLNGNLVEGNDGGVWTYNTSKNTWTDDNGNLATINFNGIASNPTNPNIAYGGATDNGSETYSGNVAWTMDDGGDDGLVRVNPLNPNDVYQAEDGVLQESTNGGKTWTTILDVSGSDYFPFAIDSVNPSRIVVGTSNGYPDLEESLDGGVTWTNLSINMPYIGVSGAGPGCLPGNLYLRPWIPAGHGSRIEHLRSGHNLCYQRDFSLHHQGPRPKLARSNRRSAREHPGHRGRSEQPRYRLRGHLRGRRCRRPAFLVYDQCRPDLGP